MHTGHLGPGSVDLNSFAMIIKKDAEYTGSQTPPFLFRIYIGIFLIVQTRAQLI